MRNPGFSKRNACLVLDYSLVHQDILEDGSPFKIDFCSCCIHNTHGKQKKTLTDDLLSNEKKKEIFEKFNIDSIPVSGKVISIKDQWRYVHPAYSDSYRVRPVDVQILIKDNLPEYINSDGVRFASLGYCLNEKINMIDDLRVEIDLKKSNSLKMSSISNEIKELGKHQSDMTRILVRFNSY